MTGISAVPPLRLAVAVVSFETRELLEQCLETVRAAGASEVVVVDNASTDGSADMVRERFPEVRLLANRRNRGYGAGANQAIAACSAPAVLLLNSDTRLAPGALAALGGHLAAHPRAALVGPRLVNADGSLQRSAYPFPSALDTLLGESGLHLAVRRIPLLRRCSWRTWEHDEARRVPWVLGAALAIRRDAFGAVGGFDEAFFMYGEEVDLCRRLSAAGFEVHYAPVTTVTHLGGASTARHADEMRREFVVSVRRYLLRHASRASAARTLAVLRAIVILRLLRDRLRLLAARDGARQRGLRRTIAGQRALLAERELWSA